MGANADEVYRYAPWFAWLWVPLTYLPQDLVYGAWFAVLAASAAFTVVGLLPHGWSGLALASIVFGGLFYAAAYGNPTPLITAVLIGTRIHPVALGLAGSLKLYPLLLCFGYLAERRWRTTAIALGTAAVLWLPALFYGLDDYVRSPGGGGISLWAVLPWIWLVFAIGSVAIAAWLCFVRSGWAWLAAAAAILLAVPRIWPGDIGYLAVILVPLLQAREHGRSRFTK